jgi:hypothetical protein
MNGPKAKSHRFVRMSDCPCPHREQLLACTPGHTSNVPLRLEALEVDR